MTRAELHNLQGFHPASLLAAAAHLRKDMKRKRASSDATAIIQNEGWMNGYLDAIEALEGAAMQQPEKKEFTPVQPYSQPQFPIKENQNKA